jgi:epoxyqueuosine reductase
VRLLARALTAAVKARARALGFDRVAVGPATPPPHAEAFERWLDAGYAGEMTYLARTRAERVEPARLLPGARSVVAVALSYKPPEDPEPGPWAPVARYARGRDYHAVMLPRLRALAAYLDEAAGPGTRSRPAVDTSAVLERDLAARAGLGWIGKNTNLLTPELGSYVLLGVVLTTAALEVDAEQPDRCGTCTACLEACPTGAFVAPWTLDARRCLSYLTIEHRGDIAPELAGALRDWAFGCDVCQEVCPWNRKAPPTREPALLPGPPPGPLLEWLDLDDAAFRARFRDSAMRRAKRRGLVRNAALVLANRGERAALPRLERLCGDADPVVRRAAAWAVERLAAGASGAAPGSRR